MAAPDSMHQARPLLLAQLHLPPSAEETAATMRGTIGELIGDQVAERHILTTRAPSDDVPNQLNAEELARMQGGVPPPTRPPNLSSSYFRKNSTMRRSKAAPAERASARSIAYTDPALPPYVATPAPAAHSPESKHATPATAAPNRAPIGGC